MNKEQYLLVKLMEECGELSQRASKAICFTSEEIQSGQDLTYAQRIVYEFCDLMVVMELLQENEVIGPFIDRMQIDLKKNKIANWAEYSKALGVLDAENEEVKKCEDCGELLLDSEIQAGDIICFDCEQIERKFNKCEGKGI